MNGVNTDFIENNGTFMVLTGAGLHSGSLNRNQCSMLSANQIAHLLKLNIQEIDFGVRLHYEITGKRMLSHLIKSEKMNQAEFYGLLLQITTVLAESKKYMLDASRFVLDENYIFVDGSLAAGTVYLTYMPVSAIQLNSGYSLASGQVGVPAPAQLKREEKEVKPDQAKVLLAFIMSLIPAVENLEGTSIQQMIKYCSTSQDFTFTGFRTLLLQLLEGFEQELAYEGNLPKAAVPVSDGSARFEIRRDSFKQEEDLREEGRWGQENREKRAETRPPYLELNDSPAGSKSAERHLFSEGGFDEASKPSSSRRTYILLGAVLVTALSWKFLYLDSPGDSGLYLSVFITIAAVVLSVLLIKRKIPLLLGKSVQSGDESASSIEFPFGRQPQTPLTEMNYFNLSGDAGRRREIPALESLLGKQPEKSGGSAVIEYVRPVEEQEEKHFMPDQGSGFEMRGSNRENHSIAKRTDPAHQRQATVLLSPEQMRVNGTEGAFGVLERREKGSETLQRIDLTAGSFVIGRTPEVAQFVENSPGTSRAHIEILVNDQNWRIKDLGSRNGTLLNGENMVPYKDYMLTPGDEFRIANVSYKLSAV